MCYMRHNRFSSGAAPPSRVPFTLIVLAVLALALLGILVSMIYWREWRVFAESYPRFADLLRLIALLIPLAFIVGYAYIGMVVLWRRGAEREQIKADKVIALANAQRELPAGVQSVSWHDSSKQLPAPPLMLPDAAPQLPPPTVPSFSQLLDQGMIGPGQRLILGYAADTAQPITGSWGDLYSCGVGALQGAGKSWLVAFLLAQSAAAGGRLIICDPHAGSDESLSNRIAALAGAFMCDVASTDDEILSALRLANDKLNRRKAGQGGDWPIIVAVDEWSSLLRGRLGDELPGLVQNISEQGRKYNVNGILSAQGWTVAAAGIVRNRLTAHYVLRQRDQEARYQLGLRAIQMPADIPSLPDATGYLLPTRGQLTKIVIPRMDAHSIARAAAQIDKPAAAGVSFGFTLPTQPLPAIVAEAKPERSQNVAASVPATSAAQSATMAPPEAALVKSLFVAGKSPAEIVAELRGVKSNEGSRYQQALNDVLDLLRKGVQ
jgi:hypothetical protein